MRIQPYFVGSGRAALAIEKAFQILQVLEPNLNIQKAQMLKRGQSFEGVAQNSEHAVLVLASPHALHAPTLIAAQNKNFKLFVVEKPAAVNLEQVESLKNISTTTALCHVYRQTWGVQELKKMISSGEFGQIICLEGRYWQSSSAQKALDKKSTFNWKNDVSLNGNFDAYLDLGSHFTDTLLFLQGETPVKTSVWMSHLNSEAAHRDTHVHLAFDFKSGARAIGSVSKTMHGYMNHFEINIVGTLKSATWKFQDPDCIEVGEGAKKHTLTRSQSTMGSQQSPYHGIGWLEGYVEIIRQSLYESLGKEFQAYPNLKDNLKMLEILLKAEGLPKLGA